MTSKKFRLDPSRRLGTMGINSLLIFLGLMNCLVIVRTIERPVIGVLMQKADPKKNVTEESSSDLVVFANYVKALEGSGAIAVPVLINQDDAYYRDVISKINGLVFPGGMADLQDPSDIGEAGGILYKMAEELNEEGVHFPILGVCQGFQLMAEASAGMAPLLTPCKGLTNVGLSLKFLKDPSESYLYRNATQEVITILKSEPVTANVHSYCVTQKTLKDYGLTATWRVISVDRDDNGLQFITSMEHTRYPFAAVQFHPEKSIYDVSEGFRFPTHYKAIAANRWFYDWIVEESKKNPNAYPKEMLARHMMANFCPSLVKENLGIVEKYLFAISIKKLTNSEIGSKVVSPSFNEPSVQHVISQA